MFWLGAWLVCSLCMLFGFILGAIMTLSSIASDQEDTWHISR